MGINYSGLDALEAVAESYERDAAWIERELGDCETRIVPRIDTATAYGIVWGSPGVVPVESLGRDA